MDPFATRPSGTAVAPPASVAAAPPPRRRRWPRRLLFLALALVLLVALSPLALSLPFVRNFVAEKASAAVGKPVRIAKASAFWGQGIDLGGIVVESGPGFDGPLATVEAVHVDVDLLALLSGRVAASVRVDRPEVTFRRDAAGRRNSEGLFPSKGEPEAAPSEPPTLDVTVAVRDGAFRAPPAGGRRGTEEGAEVTGIRADLRMLPSGALEGAVDALAKDARPGGGDAQVRVRVSLPKTGEGPVLLEVPPIDLARLSGLLEEATGTRLSGRVEAKAEGTVSSDGDARGRLTLTVVDLAAQLPDGTQVSAKRVEAKASFDGSAGASGGSTKADVALGADALAVETGRGADRQRFDEPRFDASATAQRDAKDGAWTVSVAKVAAGRALSVVVTKPLRVETGGDATRVAGAAEVSADLARLAAIVEKATGWRVGGTLTAAFDGAGSGLSDLRGKATLALRELSAEDRSAPEASRTSVAVRAVTASASFEGEAAGARADVSLALEGTRVRSAGADGVRTFDEPRVDVTAKARRTDDGDLTVESAEVKAGEALVVTATSPWTWSSRDGATRAAGKARLHADVARLAALRAFVPSMDSLRSGTVDVVVEAQAAEGLDVGAAVVARRLVFETHFFTNAGHVEEQATVRGRLRRSPKGDLTVLLHDLSTSAVTIPQDPKRAPLELALGDSVTVSGPIRVVVDLGALSRALPEAFGLPDGERLGGTLELSGTASGRHDDATVAATIAGRAIAFPPSWAAGAAPGPIDGKVKARLRGRSIEVTAEDVRGFGVALAAAATLDTGEEGDAGGLRGAQVRCTVDLAAARPWLAPFAGVERAGVLAGTLTIDSRIDADGKGRRLKGTIAGTNLRWRAGAEGGAIEEPSLSVRHDVLLAAEGGRHAFDALVVKTSALEAQVSGGATSGETTDLDLALVLTGDVARLAQQLRALSGPGPGASSGGHDDLKGSGRLSARIALKGDPADGGKALLVNGTVDPGAWTTGGFSVERATLTLQRPKVADTQRAFLEAAVNGGSVSAGIQADLAKEGTPWGGKVTVKSVDLSPVVVNGGPGRFLSFVLPTIVPAGSTAPVLSGRLDAEVSLGAMALSAPRLEDTLRGTGRVSMIEGAVKDSTLFKAIGAGGGLGDAGKVLATTVPEVGKALQELSGYAAFRRLESQFDVRDRTVFVKSLRMESEKTTVTSEGTVTFAQQANLATSVVFQGAVGDRLATVLPSRTIPLRVMGPLDKPQVVPNLNAKDLLATGLVDKVKDLDPNKVKERIKGLKDLLK